MMFLNRAVLPLNPRGSTTRSLHLHRRSSAAFEQRAASSCGISASVVLFKLTRWDNR